MESICNITSSLFVAAAWHVYCVRLRVLGQLLSGFIGAGTLSCRMEVLHRLGVSTRAASGLTVSFDDAGVSRRPPNPCCVQ